MSDVPLCIASPPLVASFLQGVRGHLVQKPGGELSRPEAFPPLRGVLVMRRTRTSILGLPPPLTSKIM